MADITGERNKKVTSTRYTSESTGSFLIEFLTIFCSDFFNIKFLSAMDHQI